MHIKGGGGGGGESMSRIQIHIWSQTCSIWFISGLWSGQSMTRTSRCAGKSSPVTCCLGHGIVADICKVSFKHAHCPEKHTIAEKPEVVLAVEWSIVHHQLTPPIMDISDIWTERSVFNANARRITCLPNNYVGPQKFQPLYFVTYDNKQYQKQHQQHHHHHHHQHHHHHRHSKQQQQQTSFEVCINIFTVTGIITFAENDNCWRSDYTNAINYRDIPQHIVLMLSFKHSQTWCWHSRVSFNFLQHIQPHIDIWGVFFVVNSKLGLCSAIAVSCLYWTCHNDNRRYILLHFGHVDMLSHIPHEYSMMHIAVQFYRNTTQERSFWGFLYYQLDRPISRIVARKNLFFGSAVFILDLCCRRYALEINECFPSQETSWHHGFFLIDEFHKSQNAPVPYPTMLHSEQKCAHFCSEWSIVRYGTGAFWDFWISFIIARATMKKSSRKADWLTDTRSVVLHAVSTNQLALVIDSFMLFL